MRALMDRFGVWVAVLAGMVAICAGMAAAQVQKLDPRPEARAATATEQQAGLMGVEFGEASPTLRALGEEEGTDKVTHHGYDRYYSWLLAPYRQGGPYNMLEIGVATGASQRMWQRYFPELRYHGFDYPPSPEAGPNIVFGDQGNVSHLKFALEHFHNMSGPMDIVIDDGSHYPQHQLLGFETIFPALRPGGLYVIEDIETSFWRRGNLYEMEMAHGPDSPFNVVGVFRNLAFTVNREFIPPHGRAERYDRDQVYVFPESVSSQVSFVGFGQNVIFVRKASPGEAEAYLGREYRFPVTIDT